MNNTSLLKRNNKKTKLKENDLIRCNLSTQLLATKRNKEIKEIISINQNSNNDELSELLKEIEYLKKENQLKDKEIQSLDHKLLDTKCNINYTENILKEEQLKLAKTKEALIISLKELEELKREKEKEWINSQGYKVGRNKVASEGLNLYSRWEDGYEIKQNELKLKEILNEKEELKKQRKKIIDNDYLEIYKFKLDKLTKEEGELKQSIYLLNKDKILLSSEDKRLKEETNCYYNKNNWPTINNRFQILSLIGRGGFSEVYKAYDLDNHILVACKIHQLNSQWSDSIKEHYIKYSLRENMIHKKVENEKVVKHYDTVEIDNNSFATVLELCSGPDLSVYLKLNGPLCEKESIFIIKQILIGLKELHSQEIIHYDLKPNNIIFNKGEIKITDFGLSKEMTTDQDKIELTSIGVGTYHYLPPEVFDPESKKMIDKKVDIWSVGIILYEMLYCCKPFGHNISQDRIFRDNLIWNSKTVEFPENTTRIIVSKETQVSSKYFNIFRIS